MNQSDALRQEIENLQQGITRLKNLVGEELKSEETREQEQQKIYDRALSFTNTQFSLLQSYRHICISFQSVLFAVGVFVFLSFPGRSFHVLWSKSLLLFLALLMLPFWVGFCLARVRAWRFFHKKLFQLEHGEHVGGKLLTEFREFRRKSVREQREFLKEASVPQMATKSRNPVFLDILLPGIFMLLWGLLFWLSISHLAIPG